jgi:Nif-specific regulatory protein
MLQVSAAISTTNCLDEVSGKMLEWLEPVFPAQRGAIVLGSHWEEFEAAYFHDWRRNVDEPFPICRSVIRRVCEEKDAVWVKNLTEADENFKQSMTASRINALLAAPLLCGKDAFGAIYLDTNDPAGGFTEEDLQLLMGIAGVASGPLANALRAARLQAENRRLEAELRGDHDMVGTSAPMREVYRFIRKVAPTGSTVLIGGESGTGKELVARAIHRNSPRAGHVFVAINCAAVAETLLESEFFGHEKGAYTGAAGLRKGKLEEAHGGSVFLDEIGELAPALQAKLLRVLQEREFERVGGTRPIRVDIRLIAATNRDLEEEVRRGRFRQDLYYRLNVVSLKMPPLRERRQDIAGLANHFLQKHGAAASRRITGISGEAQACLMQYDWPGNVRELENAIERAVVLGTTELLLPDDLPDSIGEAGVAGEANTSAKFHETVREWKRQLVMKALDQAGQNHAEAARMLGLHPNNLYRLIKTLNLKGNR